MVDNDVVKKNVHDKLVAKFNATVTSGFVSKCNIALINKV